MLACWQCWGRVLRAAVCEHGANALATPSKHLAVQGINKHTSIVIADFPFRQHCVVWVTPCFQFLTFL